MTIITKRDIYLKCAEICYEYSNYYSDNLNEPGFCEILEHKLYSVYCDKDQNIYDNIHSNNLKPFFKEWSKFSGNIVFPVPSNECSPTVAYFLESKWSNDEYGDNRRELCKYLAGQFDELAKFYELT